MPLPQNRSIILYTAGAMLIVILASLQVSGWSEDGVRIVVRMTARIAVILFSLAFTASALQRLYPSPSTTSLRRNRRYLGLSFALAHTVHLAALAALAIYFPSPFVDELEPIALIGGGLAYAFMFTMAATSNDAAINWMGGRNWRRLHHVGGWYIEFIFFQSYVPRAVQDPAYIWLAFFPIAVVGLRFASWRRRRNSDPS